MADITISTGTIRMANAPRVPGFIAAFPAGENWWIYSYRSPLQIALGSAGPETGMNPYMLVPLTPTGTNPTIYTYPAFTIQSTEDAVINPNGARWTFALMDNSSVPRFICYLANLVSVRIPSSPSTNNLTDIAGYNLTSLPPVTDGDRVILGDLYAVDGFFSGTVTAVQFVGGGAGLTGVTGATGGISNTGSTTIAADTDVDGVGIISLQTRNIERVQIANDGALNALFAFNATGLSTLAGGAQFNATQAKWSTGNIGAPSTSDQNQGSREIYYPATLGEHFARGVASGTLWDNVSLAGAYRRYFGADVINSITETNDQCLIQSDSALYTYGFQFGEDNPAILKWSVSGFPLQPSTFQWELDAAAIMELGVGAFFPNNDDTTDFGKTTKRWKNLYAMEMFIGSGNVQVGYRGIPQNSQSAAYTLVLADAGKHVLHPSADTTARIFTIPANASVAYPIGTTLTVVNQNAAGVITIAITTDTMRLAGAGTTGSRTLAANGVATAVKVTATEWIISGTGLT